MRRKASSANPICLSLPKSLMMRLKNLISLVLTARLSSVCASLDRLRLLFMILAIPSSRAARELYGTGSTSSTVSAALGFSSGSSFVAASAKGGSSGSSTTSMLAGASLTFFTPLASASNLSSAAVALPGKYLAMRRLNFALRGDGPSNEEPSNTLSLFMSRETSTRTLSRGSVAREERLVEPPLKSSGSRSTVR